MAMAFQTARTQRSRLTYARSAGTEKGSRKTRQNAAPHNVTAPVPDLGHVRVGGYVCNEAGRCCVAPRGIGGGNNYLQLNRGLKKTRELKHSKDS